MLTTVLVTCLALQGATGADEPRLAPGHKLTQVDRVVLEVEHPGIYTLIRFPQGAIVMGDKREESGWVGVQLAPGRHTFELPDGPADITALPGEVQRASSGTFLNRAVAELNSGDITAAELSLLACRARPTSAVNDNLAQMFQGEVARRNGRLAEARELLLASKDAVEAMGDPAAIAAGTDSLGQVAIAEEDWDLAQQCFERLQSLSSGSGGRAYATSRLATIADGRRDVDRARALHEEALASLDAESEAIYVSSVAFEAGRFHQDRAELARAVELYERAASSAPRWTQALPALAQICLVEMRRARYGTALAKLAEVEALAAEHSPSPHDVTVLRTRAALAFSLGEFGLAREHLEELLLLVEDADARAEIRTNLAMVSFLQDDHETALIRYDEALSATPETSRLRCFALNGKSAVLIDADRPEEARPLAREALELAKQLGDAELQAATMITVSLVSASLGEGDAARAEADAAVAFVQSQDARDLLLSAWHNVARAALIQGDEAAVDDLLGRAWSESMRDELSELPSLDAAQVRSRLSELAEWSEVAADLVARRVQHGTGDLDEGFRQVDSWKARTLVADIRGGPAPLSGTGPAGAAAGGRALVEYAFGESRLYAFVSDGGGLRFVDLGPRKPIESLTRSFVEDLRDERVIAGPAQVVRDGSALHERLVAPLGLASGSVVIVPSGVLSQLPFEALVAAAPESPQSFEKVEFVLDRMDVGYAPSAATLAALDSRSARAPSGRAALLLGDPTYATEADGTGGGLLATRTSSGARWARVPHTRGEVTRVARILLGRQSGDEAQSELIRLAEAEGTRDASLSTPAFELRLGKEASVSALSSLAPGAKLIHIAAHAQLDPWDSRRTGLVLAWDDQEQGLFTLADIAGLRLDAELVVLSGCETAGGRLLNDEGVQSMAEAFLAAGARSVVASLWPVSDPQSQSLMERFSAAYLAEGEAPDHALRRAKRELRAGRPVRGALPQAASSDPRRGHPHYWAAFLFNGAPGPARR